MAKDIEKAKKRIRGIVPSKNNPMYNSHMYWSQKSYNICDILIEELSDKGETVFDPFMGSGVTVLEALRKTYGRNAIGCEINEAPLFIVSTILKEYNLAEYHKKSQEVSSRIQGLKEYYKCSCPSCGKDAYTTTVIFDKEDRESEPVVTKINLMCPSCKRVIKNTDAENHNKMNGEYTINNVHPVVMMEDSKLAVYKGETIEQIFTRRNLKVLDEIIGIIDEYPEYKELYKYILMSVLHLCKITDTHSNSQWPLWIPKKNCVEKNVVDIVCKKIEKFEETITFLSKEYDDKKQYILLNKGSQNITSEDIEDNSVDLIITDPPYLGQVAYSEYMQLYKPFLGLDFNLEDEIIVTSTPDRKITEKEYFDLLDRVFGVCDKKIKTGGYFCMYFHDCNLNVWNTLINSMAAHHFKYISQEHIKKSNTLKNIISPKKSLSGDAIIFFVNEDFEYREYEVNESFEEIEENVIKQIIATIEREGPLSTPELYDGGVIEYLVYNGWLEIMSKHYKTLVEVFEKCLKWEPESNKWIL